MNTAAIKHSPFDNYCYPLNKDELQINIETGKDVTAVYLIYGDPFQSDLINGEWVWRNKRIPIENHRRLPDTLLWTTTVKPEFKRIKYYFELHSSEDTKLLFEDGFYAADIAYNQKEASPFIYPWMNESDIVSPPAWAENTIWYQIFPSRFARGTSSPHDKELLPWAPSYQSVKNEDYYGGNLAGIIEHLDYLEDLGINGLYMNPINLSPSQHKYDTEDYLKIDPEFGDEEALKTLVQKAHERGMHVMLDGVFNHCGWNFFAWQDVLKNRAASRYADWFMVRDWDFPAKPGDNSAKGAYLAFAFADTMPKLNTNNPEVREYLCSICENWIKTYDIDALRLDVANELSHTFCRMLRERLRAIKPNFFFVGEIWTDAQPWLRGYELDSVINYPLRSAIYNFAAHVEKDVRYLEASLNKCLTRYARQTERVLINQMDSHDTARLITRTGNNVDLTLQQFALVLALPGAACMYYGTEVLLPGGEDPDNRRCMPWQEIAEGRFNEALNFTKTLVHLRREHAALRSDCFSMQYANNDLNGKRRFVVLEKRDEATGEKIACLFNFGRQSVTVKGDNALEGSEILVSRLLVGDKLLPGGIMFVKK